MKLNKKESEFKIQKEELSEVKWYDVDKIVEMVANKNEDLLITDKMIDILRKINLYNKNN